ncbi:Tol-Pal system beta propeller repeat protein TolB [Brytella acorum]|uniref:Tol-Pal system protein TolB n=1 Tax=Brytella acorum TaxID=2959299 RepID=A0AA35Y431_9PROT|nr:Tol-Pal system beta propeller repeat protein TolB [Brytella acorum]MDF3623853.1 Tol-Pal system beta propeller repeat protein TolB [Brytella acorum]CAI9120769.1 Tol-Pal system beta propeller repeat protein TolB [Brytella acorum]
MRFDVQPLIDDNQAQELRNLFSRRALIGGAVATGVLALPLSARAQTTPATGGGEAEITVDQARTAPIPIVIPSFGAGLGDQISGVVISDLEGTGLFKVMSGQVGVGGTPDFASLKAQGARAAVGGLASGSGSVRVEMRLWDVLAGEQLQGTAYTASSANWRRIAHIIADVIYERMLGEKGYFDTRLAYIARTGARHRQTTRLAIMDYDGANSRMLTSGEWLTLMPRFNPTRDQIAFLSYANDRPRVYVFDLASGRQRILGEFQGISFAPRFSPNGSQIVLSATRGGGSDLFLVDLGSGSKRQITSSGAIDTSPCFSPDGSQIVFVSDRGGTPQLYLMSASGGGAKRISYGQGTYGSPVWSPRGDLIAYTRLSGGRFALGVMGPDGTGERILTEGFTVEGPTFCPNGRVIAFCRQSAAGAGGAGFASGIGTIDITGFNERPVQTGTGASDPAWSPRDV